MLVRIEKKAISIIIPGKSCNNKCEILGVTPMVDNVIRYVISFSIASQSDKDHRLDSLLSPLYRNLRYNLRNHSLYSIPDIRTNKPNERTVLYLPWPAKKIEFYR